MRDHEVFQTVYGVYLELGNGTEIYAGPPILTRANMNEEEYQETSNRLHREEYEGPDVESPRRLRLRQWRLRRRRRRTSVIDDDLHQDELRALRGKADVLLPGRRFQERSDGEP